MSDIAAYNVQFTLRLLQKVNGTPNTRNFLTLSSYLLPASSFTSCLCFRQLLFSTVFHIQPSDCTTVLDGSDSTFVIATVQRRWFFKWHTFLHFCKPQQKLHDLLVNHTPAPDSLCEYSIQYWYIAPSGSESVFFNFPFRLGKLNQNSLLLCHKSYSSHTPMFSKRSQWKIWSYATLLE